MDKFSGSMAALSRSSLLSRVAPGFASMTDDSTHRIPHAIGFLKRSYQNCPDSPLRRSGFVRGSPERFLTFLETNPAY